MADDVFAVIKRNNELRRLLASYVATEPRTADGLEAWRVLSRAMPELTSAEALSVADYLGLHVHRSRSIRARKP